MDRQVPLPIEPRSAALDEVTALLAYDPVVRALVLAAKNGGRRHLLTQWGRDMARLAVGPDDTVAGGGHSFDTVTWVPASRQGARSRGYDQGRLLAKATARQLGLPARRLLVRRPGPTRAGVGRVERLIGPSLRCPIGPPARVLVVDDVLTTGASMAAAARALRSAGAVEVSGLVVAAVPDRPDAAKVLRSLGYSGPSARSGERRMN